jgi:AmmeMemoRadiSam system protein A
MKDQLTPEERDILLQLARQGVEAAACGLELEPLDLQALPPALVQPGAAFVTLTRLGQLRGCVGTLEASQPLAVCVREHGVAAALHDYRFPPVRPEELAEIEIEVSRLTLPRELPYECPEDLLAGLKPGVDGVILRDGMRRATFLPQVWEKLPEPALFLSHLCEKMGADPFLWQRRRLQVSVYQVEMFHEEKK